MLIEFLASKCKMGKPRCEVCGAKLNLADQTIGLCKCELVFCKEHRLPESHACVYNFKRLAACVLPEAMIPQKVVKI